MEPQKTQKVNNEQDFDIVFIRHAQSNFNKGGYDYVGQYNLHHLGWLDLIKIQQFNTAVTYNPIYIDPHITQHGVSQCIQATKKFTPSQIDLILVSPQLRALQTCQHIFGHRNSKVIVHPLVTEVVRYSCDVSHQMQYKIDLFPHYNFQEMKNWSNQWYLEVLSQEKKNILNDHFETQGAKDFKARQLVVIDLLRKQLIAQSAKQLRERVGKLKQLIKEMKQKYNAKKVAVISHHYTTQCLMAPDFHQDGQVKGIGEVVNAVPYFRKLQDILRVK